MSTATRSRPKASALAELEPLERQWQEAEQNASQLGRDFTAKLHQARELTDQRNRLLHREPGLADHRGQPLDPDNAVGQVDKQLAKLGDLQELQAKYEHAKQLAERAKREALEFVAEHFATVVKELEPQAEAVVASVHESAVALAEAAGAYLGFAQRVDGLRASDRKLAQVRVSAIDVASDLVRLTAGYRDARLPLPTELR